MFVRKRVLVSGGAGFLGSHLCERLLADRHEVLCVDNFFTGNKENIAHLVGNPLIRVNAPRRDVSAVCRGRPDLQPRLPGLTHSLSARSGADDQDERSRRDQHARSGEADEGAHPASFDQRSLRRPGDPSADRGISRRSQSDRRSRLLRRRQALRRDIVLRLPSAVRLSTSASLASSIPMARACIRTTAGSSPTSSFRR